MNISRRSLKQLMHITLAYWISGLSEESPHAIHFYSIKGHACDHHKKKRLVKVPAFKSEFLEHILG